MSGAGWAEKLAGAANSSVPFSNRTTAKGLAVAIGESGTRMWRSEYGSADRRGLHAHQGPGAPPVAGLTIIAVEWVASVGYGNEPAAVMHPGGNWIGLMLIDGSHDQGGSVAER